MNKFEHERTKKTLRVEEKRPLRENVKEGEGAVKYHVSSLD